MDQAYFEFRQLNDQSVLENWPEILASECFLLDCEKGDFHLCQRLAQILFSDSARPPAHVSAAQLAEILTPRSREVFLRDLERLRENRTTAI